MLEALCTITTAQSSLYLDFRKNPLSAAPFFDRRSAIARTWRARALFVNANGYCSRERLVVDKEFAKSHDCHAIINYLYDVIEKRGVRTGKGKELDAAKGNSTQASVDHLCLSRSTFRFGTVECRKIYVTTFWRNKVAPLSRDVKRPLHFVLLMHFRIQSFRYQ